jgi:hypothetical protein
MAGRGSLWHDDRMKEALEELIGAVDGLTPVGRGYTPAERQCMDNPGGAHFGNARSRRIGGSFRASSQDLGAALQ